MTDDEAIEMILEWRKARKKETNHKWREAHPEYRHEYYEDNKEKEKETNHKWRKANPEKKREYFREYREANKEKVKEYNHQYHEENREKLNEGRFTRGKMLKYIEQHGFTLKELEEAQE